MRPPLRKALFPVANPQPTAAAGESVWTARDLDYKRKRSTAEAKARRAAAEEASAAAAEALRNGEAWSLVARAPWAEKVRRWALTGRLRRK